VIENDQMFSDFVPASTDLRNYLSLMVVSGLFAISCKSASTSSAKATSFSEKRLAGHTGDITSAQIIPGAGLHLINSSFRD
jgi:hypothetical protein